MPTAMRPSLEQIRSRFPALHTGFAFMDNAGGSQVPETVADAVRDYMLTSYVQVGASYPASRKATATVAEAHEMVNILFGGQVTGKVIFGASSSALCRMLSDCYAEILQPGDEIVVATSGHEANVYPWISLETRGLVVKLWQPDAETGRNSADDLRELVTARTKVIAFPHVSNILGALEEVEEVVEIARSVGAKTVLDSVAYAPHLPMDVSKWGVDWCVFSCYKVFGPHMAALYGTREAMSEITGRNHPFIARDEHPLKFELGGVLHEGCAGLLALRSYFAFLAGDPNAVFSRRVVQDAFATMESFERPLTTKLMAFLNSKPKVRVIGPATAGPERVATVSFVHESLSTPEIAIAAEKHDIGMRFGNFYSVRLMERLGLPVKEGVARVSFAHYNTPEEVDRLIGALDPIL